MSNAIGPQAPASITANLRAEPGGQPAGADASKGWNAALQQAQADGFHGWFQPPGPQHALGVLMRSSAASVAAVHGLHRSAGLADDRAPAAPVRTKSVEPTASSTHAAASNIDGNAAAPGSSLAGSAEAGQGTPNLAPASWSGKLASMLVDLTGQPVRLSSALSTNAAHRPLAAWAGESALSASALPAGAPGSGASTNDTESAEMLGPTSMRGSPPSTQERDPLRVHAQWSEEGVQLWLGADVGGLVAVDAVAARLQNALAAQGVRLLRVVCNGHDVAIPTLKNSLATTRFEFEAERASAAAADTFIPPIS